MQWGLAMDVLTLSTLGITVPGSTASLMLVQIMATILRMLSNGRPFWKGLFLSNHMLYFPQKTIKLN